MGEKQNQAQLPLFLVTFTDNTHYKGKTSYYDTGWQDIPTNKKIDRIFFLLPSKDYICLDGYDKYYYLLEATKDWMRVNKRQLQETKSELKLEYLYIMARKGDNVISYKIVLLNRTHQTFEIKLQGEKETKNITCGKGKEFYTNINGRYVKVFSQHLKDKDKIYMFSYKRKRMEEFKVISKKIAIQNDKYKVGDITIRIFDVNDERIKKLNPNMWR